MGNKNAPASKPAGKKAGHWVAAILVKGGGIWYQPGKPLPEAVAQEANTVRPGSAVWVAGEAPAAQEADDAKAKAQEALDQAKAASAEADKTLEEAQKALESADTDDAKAKAQEALDEAAKAAQ